MAHSLSAKKRIRQNKTHQLRNRARKSELKTEIRRFLDTIHDRKVDEAREQLKRVYKQLDQTAAKGTIHSNTASRNKARLAKRLAALEVSISAGD